MYTVRYEAVAVLLYRRESKRLLYIHSGMLPASCPGREPPLALTK